MKCPRCGKPIGHNNQSCYWRCSNCEYTELQASRIRSTREARWLAIEYQEKIAAKENVELERTYREKVKEVNVAW